MRRLRKSQLGFTLLELLVVVIIVGILATIAIPQFRRTTDRTREAEAKNIISSILTAEMAYFQENGTFTDVQVNLLVGVPIMRDWAPPTYESNGTVGTTPDSVTVTSLSDGVIVETTGGTAAVPGPPHGHNHTTHVVRGAISSTGSKRIVASGSF